MTPGHIHRWRQLIDDRLGEAVAAFGVHVRGRPEHAGPWTRTPDPDLDEHLAELRHLVTRLDNPAAGEHIQRIS